MNVVAQQLLQRHGLTAVIGALVIGLLAAIGYETGWGSGLRPAPALARSEAAKRPIRRGLGWALALLALPMPVLKTLNSTIFVLEIK